MADNLKIPDTTDKSVIYEELIPQIRSLVETESDLIANLANIAAILKEEMDFFWVGFYFVKGEELVLGPFQGPVACTRIERGKGVCGEAWERGDSILVPNVNQFPGHIACNARSKSEIVLPIFQRETVFIVLDIDSDTLNDFDEIDEKYLFKIKEIIEQMI